METTAAVQTLTDELLGEIEQECKRGVDVYIGRRNARALIAEIRTLRAENAELRKDAERGNWLIEYMASEREDLDDTLMEGCSDNRPHVLRSIIDSIMEQSK